MIRWSCFKEAAVSGLLFLILAGSLSPAVLGWFVEMAAPNPVASVNPLGLGALLLITLGCLAAAVRALVLLVSPSLHPLQRVLSASGPAEESIRQIDEQLNQPDSTRLLGSVLVTPSWIIAAGLFRLTIVRREDLAWIYGEQKQDRFEHLPFSWYFVVMWDRWGREQLIRCTAAEAKELLAELASSVPWAICGHSPTLRRTWFDDREGFLAMVAERRHAAKAAGGDRPGKAGRGGTKMR